MQKHTESYPDGPWREANEELSRIWYEADPILRYAGIDPYRGGNEARV